MADHKCEVCGKPATWRIVDKQEVVADGSTATIHLQHLPPHYFCDEHKREERLTKLDPAPAMDLNREPGAAANPLLAEKWRAAKRAAETPAAAAPAAPEPAAAEAAPAAPEPAAAEVAVVPSETPPATEAHDPGKS